MMNVDEAENKSQAAVGWGGRGGWRDKDDGINSYCPLDARIESSPLSNNSCM